MAHTESLANPTDVVITRVESMPFGENTYVVRRQGDTRCIVIDPGFEPDPIVEAIESEHLSPECILLTHGHSDHIAGNGALRKIWPSLPILIGANDAHKLQDAQANLSGPFGFLINSPPADRLLNDEELIELAGISLSVHEIPGHSIGHVVFRVHDCTPPLVFAGDVLFHEGIGRTDFSDGNFESLADGIRNILYALPDDTIVFPGHGNPTTIGHERVHNPFVPDARAGQ